MLQGSIKATSISSFVYVKIVAVFRKDLKKTMFYWQMFDDAL